MVNFVDVDELLTLKQAAKEKGGTLTESAVWRAVQRGSLKSTAIAGHLFVSRADLAEWNPAQERIERAKKAAKARWDKEKEG